MIKWNKILGMLLLAVSFVAAPIKVDKVLASKFGQVKIKGATSGNLAEVNSSNQLHVVLMGKVDDNNSSVDTLDPAGVFQGTATDILDFGYIFVTVYSDVASATDGLSAQQSSDGTNWDNTDEYTVSAATGKTFSFQPGARYFRIVYTNGGTIQSVFRLQTVFKKTSSLSSSHRIQDSIIDDDDAILTKTVLTGETAAGTFINFSSTNNGNFKVSLEELENQVSSNSNSQLNVTNFDSSGNEGITLIDGNDGTRAAEFDNLFKVPIVIDVGHHEIHEGDSFLVCNADTSMSSGATMIYAFKTPAGLKRAHVLLDYDTLVGAHVEVVEGPTWTNQSGSLKPIYNRKREVSMKSSTLLEDSGQAAFTATDNIILNPTGLAGGTILHCFYTFGSKNNGASPDRSVNELMLKPDTQYAFVFTSDAAANKGYMVLDWYEHTDE